MINAVSTKNSNRPFIEINVNGQNSTFLFDSGAETSLMSTKNFRKISLNNRPKKVDDEYVSFSAANGKPLKINGTYLVDMKINNHLIKQKIRVCDDLKDINILGIDAIKTFGLNFHAKTGRLFFDEPKVGDVSPIFCAKAIKIEPMSTKTVKVKLTKEMTQQGVCVASLGGHKHPLVVFEPGLVDTNSDCYVSLHNCSPVGVEIERDAQIGFIQKINMQQIHPVDFEILNVEKGEKQKQEIGSPTFLSPERKNAILSQLKINIDDPTEKQKYLNLVFKYHHVFSLDKNELGRANHFEQKIEMKDRIPVYTKQFKIPLAHQEFLEKQIKEWLNIGIIQRSRSLYNSPIFLVPKKDGTLRAVCDYRRTNEHSLPDLYSQRDVIECINEIGQSHSTIFSTFDLTSGFWQLPLHPDSRKYTAFTVPSMNQQFQWTVSAMGLQSSPSCFQRCLEAACQGLKNLLIYIDDVIVHSKTHSDHRANLEEFFKRMAACNMKLNLKKSCIGAKEVVYLGFRLTPEGILPGKDKLKAVELFPPPTTVKQIKQFLGLCNFFRQHIRNFSLISAPLNHLTRKNQWNGGKLPKPAFDAFQTHLSMNRFVL